MALEGKEFRFAIADGGAATPYFTASPLHYKLHQRSSTVVRSFQASNARDGFLVVAVAARKDGDGYVEVIIGVLTAIMLLLLVVFVIILIVSRRHKLQGSPTLLRNPFGVTINMKV